MTFLELMGGIINAMKPFPIIPKLYLENFQEISSLVPSARGR